MKSIPLTLLAVLLTVAAAPAFESFTDSSVPHRADGTMTERPQLAAKRIAAGSVILDGRLEESVWADAELAAGFRQNDPERGTPASVRTTFKVLYDDHAVYFGVACFEHDTSLISSALSRRDNIHNSDIVSIYIDPYHDHTTGYNFRVNPQGVLQDAYIFADGRRDRDWDAVWDAAAYRDERGWFVEMRIPFSAIRYQPGDGLVWGLQVYRWMHGRGEDTGWVVWDRDVPGFVSRFGTLTGLDGLTASRQLEITPYVVGRVTDYSEPGVDAAETYRNLGADVKYGVTANMTLQATIQPDFGQVEADPSVLNLSPFETFYSEKRPFFVEGSRFFDHREFNLFYSRRIGTGGENSRIRCAGKLIGKTGGDISVAALAATTDVTESGEAWNAFKSGGHKAHFGVLRLGSESADGNRSIHVMQTAVIREATPWLDDDSDRLHRNGYASGIDFDLDFDDRNYNVAGSFVRTVVSPHDEAVDAGAMLEQRVGSGGFLSARKAGGDWRYGVNGLWESDRLDPNDAGRLSAPDEIETEMWVDYQFNSDGEDSWIQRGSIHCELEKSWFYAGSTVHDPDNPDQELWSYGRGLHRGRSADLGFNIQTSGHCMLWGGGWLGDARRGKYGTRDFDGRRGPLKRSPAAWSTWLGYHSDRRNDLTTRINLDFGANEAGGYHRSLNWAVNWNQSEHLSHYVDFGYSTRREDDQWLLNTATETGGIGGVHYVFGRLDQRTWDMTLRSSFLLDPSRSLELYLQPFLTVGDYSDPRSLARPDSYDWVDYAPDGYDVQDHDFSFAAVNLNLVYRWEYRPGSTLFLVWSHSRDSYHERGEWIDDTPFGNEFDPGLLLEREAQNIFLCKFTYWFPV